MKNDNDIIAKFMELTEQEKITLLSEYEKRRDEQRKDEGKC